MNRKSLLIWGATGQSKVVYDIVKKKYRLIALIDKSITQSPLLAPIYPSIEELMMTIAEPLCDITYVIAVAGPYMGKERVRLHEMLNLLDMQSCNVIHRTAVVSSHAVLGEGCQILTHASVCTYASLGKCCIVNTGASVDHDCVLGDGVHVCPGAHVLGEVSIDNYATLGAGSIILPRLHIGQGAIIGAGAIVTKDIPDHCVAVGNPAKIIRSLSGNEL